MVRAISTYASSSSGPGPRRHCSRCSATADFSDRDVIHLRGLGVDPVALKVEAASQNPLKDLSYLMRLARVLRALRPDLVHNFSVKPVIYGSLAAKLVGIAGIVNSVTGSGMLRAGE